MRARPGGCARNRARAHDTGAKRARPGPSWNGVATHFLVSLPGLAGLVTRHTFWCNDMVGLHGVATHYWCRDTEAERRAILVSQHGLVFLVSRSTVWCRDMV